MNRIFIVGAGYVGGALALKLYQSGYRIQIGKRRPRDGLDPSLQTLADQGRLAVLELDVCQPVNSFPLAGSAMVNSDTLIYCVSASGFSKEEYQRSYYEGLANCLTWLGQIQPAWKGRVLFVSSTGVYGQADEEWVDESSETKPEGFSGKVILAAEEYLARWQERRCTDGLDVNGRTTSVRFSGIYGPQRTRLVRDVQKRIPVSPQRWAQWTNRIHRDDCVGVIEFLLQQERWSPCYLASDKEPVRYGEIATWMAGQLGIEPPPISSDATVQAGLERGANKRCQPKRLLSLGYEFQFPSFREGYSPLISDFLEEK